MKPVPKALLLRWKDSSKLCSEEKAWHKARRSESRNKTANYTIDLHWAAKGRNQAAVWSIGRNVAGTHLGPKRRSYLHPGTTLPGVWE